MPTNVSRLIGSAGIGLGLLIGAFTAQVSQAAAEGPCEEACTCQSNCEEQLRSCNERCDRLVDAEKTKCIIECNNKLLKCMEACPSGDCDCGAY